MTSIRRARPEEAASITRLAIRSKAHWGYDEAQMSVFIDELTLTADDLRSDPVWVAEEGETVVGFCSLKPLEGREIELGHLFIEPAALRRGHGTRLLAHAREQARVDGYERLLVQSDPHAEAFYRVHGADWLRQVPTRIPGRKIPLLAFALEEKRS